MGHAERTCLIGLRLADAIGLEPARRSSLFYALLLKDAGCSTTAAATAEAFGSDDLQVKRESRLIDPNRPALSLGYLKRNVAPGAPLRQRARHLRAVIAMSNGGVSELQRMRCERGADIARGIGLDEEAAAAIGQLFEHWDGQGHPGDRAGEQISLLARIVVPGADRWRSSGSRAGPRPRSTSRAPGAAPGTTPRSSTPSACSSATARSGPAWQRPTCRAWSPPTGSSAPTPAGWIASPRRSRASSTPSRPTPRATAPAWRRSPTASPRRSGSTTPPADFCAARRCCTTSASSASPTASSTSPAR